MESILKDIVWNVNELVKKANHGLLSQKKANVFFQKIHAHWPLERGSVAKKRAAWNELPSSAQTIQAMVAFLIKCASVLRNDLKKSELCLFENDDCTAFFWSDVKKYYTSFSMDRAFSTEGRPLFFEKHLPKNCCVVLCLEDTFFRIRSGINQELAGFELFLDDLFKSNNGLVVFSTQQLMASNTQKQEFNYGVSFKIGKTNQNLSIQQVMEPQDYILRSAQFIDANRTGGFDRLVDLLTTGENFISAIDNRFYVS